MTFLRCEHYSEKDHRLNFGVYHWADPAFRQPPPRLKRSQSMRALRRS